MTTATPMPAQVRQTLIAVLNQLDNGEAGDLLGEAFDVDQDGYADAVRDLAWCRNELAELLGVPPGTAITADYDQAQPAPEPPSPELMNAMAEAARLSQKLRFLAGDVESYLAEMKRRQMEHVAGDSIKALRQSLGIAESVLRESQAHQPVLAEIALWKNGHAELERASCLLLRTVNDTLRHGLTLTQRANLEAVCRELAPLIRRELREGSDRA